MTPGSAELASENRIVTVSCVGFPHAAFGRSGAPSNDATVGRYGTRFLRCDHRRRDRLLSLGGRALGPPLLPSEGLHPRLHYRTRLRGPHKASTRATQGESDRAVRRYPGCASTM